MDQEHRAFVDENWGKLSVSEIAGHLHLPAGEVAKYGRASARLTRQHGRRSARSLVLLGSAFVIAALGVGALVWASPREPKVSVEELLAPPGTAPLGSVVYCSRRGGDRAIYIIAQEHYFALALSGQTHRPTLPAIQALTIDRLAKRRGLRLVVGEGFAPGEFRRERTKTGVTKKTVRAEELEDFRCS